MTASREYLKEWAKNLQGDKHKFKTVCTTAVARFFDADSGVHYLHSMEDLVRAVRKKGFTVRSRKSSVKGTTVGKIRSEIPKLGKDGYYIVRVTGKSGGHVLLLDNTGKTVVDTAPKLRDTRKITHLYKVFVDTK